ncbi:unnamed protein product [Effrenium voratum]|nr:unnamed protein product [Effrenium voratum]
MGDSDRDMNGIVKLPASAACQSNEAMMVAPFEQHGFRFNLTGSGLLSYAEFERMVLAQDGSMSREDVGALWRLADADGNGRLDLNEFVGLLRQAQLEGMTAAARQPANISEQDMILEARVAQMERSFRNRGVTLLQACQMMDVARTGFLDRSGLRRLMSAAGLDLATWEQEELTRRCDPGRNGLLNYYELARQFDFEAQAKALAAQAPGAVLAPGAVSDPLKDTAGADAGVCRFVYSLAQGFGLFDQTGGGTLDRSGFMRFLDWAQVSMAATEQDALFQRFPSPPGLLNYRAIINQFDTWHDSISTQTCCPQPASPKHIYQPSGSSRPTTNSVGACHKPKLGCATATCYSKDSQPAHITSMSCAGALPSGNANRKPGTTISDCCAICTGSPRHAKPTWQLHVFCAYSAGSTNSTGSRPTWPSSSACASSPKHAKPTGQFQVFCTCSAGITNPARARPTWSFSAARAPNSSCAKPSWPSGSACTSSANSACARPAWAFCSACTSSVGHAQPTWQLHVFCACSTGRSNSTRARPTWPSSSAGASSPRDAKPTVQFDVFSACSTGSTNSTRARPSWPSCAACASSANSAYARPAWPCSSACTSSAGHAQPTW